jgi:hypothetical protein
MRMVLGGIADRIDLGLDELDDLQLAVERLLDEARAGGSVELTFELGENGMRTHIGPLRESALAAALQCPEPRPGRLTLRRVLETLVDSFGVEDVGDEGLVVRLEKRVRRTA